LASFSQSLKDADLYVHWSGRGVIQGGGLRKSTDHLLKRFPQ